MGNFKDTFKRYWIFLVTVIFYGLGLSIHFIAQWKGPHPHNGREILERTVSQIHSVKATSKLSNNTVSAVDSNSKYAKPDNLFYFIQITDVHMSDKYSRGAQGHLYYFLKKMIPIIDPNFLFITGDITDSLTKTLTIATQKEDWIMYRKIIEDTGVNTKNNGTFLWDLRGNHDCFMVPEWSSEYNYFKDYSQTKTRGFSFTYDTDYGTYSFIGIDGCPILTTTNPFFGIVDEVTMEKYGTFMEKARSNPINKHNFVLSHYPETTLKFGKSLSGKEWNNYTKDISLLLSGHFHTIGGEHVYAYHKDYLEIELTDFKLHGRYRIISVDNDVVNFSDKNLPLPYRPFNFETGNIDELIKNPPSVFNDAIPPIVHITLPKNSRFNLKKKEPIKESYESEYVRVLIFSQHPPSSLVVKLYVDDVEQSTKFEYVGDQKLAKRSSIKVHKRDGQDQLMNESHTVEGNTPPLWIAKWDKSRFNDGKSHTLKVEAFDSQDKLAGDDSISFRMDGKDDDLGIPFMASFVLKSVMVKSLPVMFGIVFVLFDLIILFSRLYSVKHIIPNHPEIPFFPKKYIGDIEELKKFREGGFFKKHFIGPLIQNFTYNGIFYPIQILLICLLVLPGKIGITTRSSKNVVDVIGGEFLYGSYTSGQWSNVFDQYGMYLLFLFLFPILDIIIMVSLNHKKDKCKTYKIVMLSVLSFIQIVTCIVLSIVFGGILAVFLSPFPNYICIYCWALIYMIVVRRHKYSKEKPISPELPVTHMNTQKSEAITPELIPAHITYTEA